jgi:multicomponent K+:H+ antiporter subunit D
MFAILTKVGVYAVLRLWTCASRPAPAHRRCSAAVLVGAAWRRWPSAPSACSARSSSAPRRLQRDHVVGHVLAVIGLDQPGCSRPAPVLPGQLHPGRGALFLLVELVERWRQAGVDPPSPDDNRRPLPAFGEAAPADVNLDDSRCRWSAGPSGRAGLPRRQLPGCARWCSPGCRRCPASSASSRCSRAAESDASASAGAPARRGWMLFALLILSGLLAAAIA